MISLPSVDYLRECFDLTTQGVLRWRERPQSHFRTCRGWKTFNAQFAGKTAGTPSTGGYLVISINKRLYKVHRIVFALANNREPRLPIDHRNGTGDDNRPENLREATATQNQLNKRGSGVLGVKNVYRRGKSFEVKLRKPGGQVHRVGCFQTLRGAILARDEAIRRIHGEFGRFK